MTTIKDTLTDVVKTAMKARELEKVKVLRSVQAVIKQIEIDRQLTLDDAGVLDILQKQTKQRQESLAIFAANGRADLAQKEQCAYWCFREFLALLLACILIYHSQSTFKVLFVLVIAEELIAM